MMSVLLLTFTVSTGFVSNGYPKAYAAADFPTSDLGTKIRESINGIKELFPASPSEFSIVKIMLSGFPHQTGDSITNVGLTPSPCRVHNDITCTGFSHIMIPGIGDGQLHAVLIILQHLRSPGPEPHLLSALIYGIISVACLSVPPPCSLPVVIHISFAEQTYVTRTIDIPGIGSGQATVQVL